MTALLIVCALLAGTWLFARSLRQDRRIEAVQRQVNALMAGAARRTQTEAGREVGTVPAPVPVQPSGPVPQPPPARSLAYPSAARAAAAPTVASYAAVTPLAEIFAASDASAAAAARDRPTGSLLAAARRWFTHGNVPVKVGVLVLFAGITALYKYALGQHWLHFPIGYRLLTVSAVAVAALVFAWRRRNSHRHFALGLQGGAIGVLLLTVFAAFRLYHLLPGWPALLLVIALVTATGALAIVQDARALAALGIVGGFLAPILIATGSASQVALFSFYAVLDLAIFAVAWWRPWRELNLLGFAFTFIVASAWGVFEYRPALFAGTEPFLLLFFALYLLIPVLYALRQPAAARGLVDGTLVFATPLLAFFLQAALLRGNAHALALSALGAAAVYAILATLERGRLRLPLLGAAHARLAVGMATLAVPLGLSARATTCVWALEGVALVWLGLRQHRRLTRCSGYALQVLAAGAYAVEMFTGTAGAHAQPILNGPFLSMTMLALSALVSARVLVKYRQDAPVAVALLVWGCVWWLGCGSHEIARFVPSAQAGHWGLGFLALSGWLAAETRQRLDWPALLWPALLGLASAVLFLLPLALLDHAPLHGYGALAWALWLVASLRTLYVLRPPSMPVVIAAHALMLLIVAAVLSMQCRHMAGAGWHLLPLWIGLAGVAPFALLDWLALRRLRLVRWPMGDAAEASRGPLLAMLGVGLGLAWYASLFAEGSPAPLPFIPLLNPLELAQFLYVALLLAWYRDAAARAGKAWMSRAWRARLLVLIGFMLLTSITLRGVHHLTGLSWDLHLLQSTLAQAALAVVWSVAGIGAMLLGARRASRDAWLGGAALMGLVLLKLVFVDRRHLGDLAGIVGFIVVGLLLLLVGYFAPAPPRQGAIEAEPGPGA